MIKQILLIALLIVFALLTYSLFYPGAVFVLAILIEVVLYAGIALTLFFWRRSSKWRIAVLCVSGAIFLSLSTLGCLKLVRKLPLDKSKPACLH